MKSSVSVILNDMYSSLSFVHANVNLSLEITFILLILYSVKQPISLLMFSTLLNCTMHRLLLRSVDDFRVNVILCFSLAGNATCI